MHLVPKVIAAALLIALAGCGGSKLPEGAHKDDPPEVVAEYARIAKMSDCNDIYGQWYDHWVHADKHLGEPSRDAAYAGALAIRGHKVGCSPFNGPHLPPPPCGILVGRAC